MRPPCLSHIDAVISDRIKIELDGNRGICGTHTGEARHDTMKFSDLAGDTTNLPHDIAEIALTGLASDSRKIVPGNLFVALAGYRQDGTDFISDAVDRGAAAIVASAERTFPDPGVPVIRVGDPRRFLARAAARFHRSQPGVMIAVTGTAGKTSVASFTRQIWERAGNSAAMIGTTGVTTPKGHVYGQLTTPDPVELHALLADLARDGVTHCSMEASSHGLDQHRLDGVSLAAGAFTNLGRDHLDYHRDMEDYFAAKMRLFSDLLPQGAPAVIWSDDEWSGRAEAAAMSAGLNVLTVGRKGSFLSLKRVEHQRNRQVAEIHHLDKIYEVDLPLAGDFQLANALVAAGLAIATGVSVDDAMAALEHLHGASGRLELVATNTAGSPAYVDYAHKPDALEQVLTSVRPFTTNRVIVVFGCGGDRDRGKRPIMGEIATRLADVVIVTDDNPRSEEPAAIRSEIMAEALGAIEIGDRSMAIAKAVSMLEEGDTLIVAGKGHEEGQTIGDKVLPFSDHAEIRKAMENVRSSQWLWASSEMVKAMGGRPVGTLPEGVNGISIDSRSVKRGEAFFAIKGDRVDGHDYASSAMANGAGVLVVSEAKLPAMGHLQVPLIVVNDVLEALERLAVASRRRSEARIIAVTGSVGKTTTKEMLRQLLSAQGKTHASIASFNNHWGVPLTLVRMPRDTQFGVFEIGMNHPGEIRPLVKMVRPHIAIITAIASAHLGFFKNLGEIAAAKAEIFEGVEPDGHVLLNRDSEKFTALKKAAAAIGIANIHSFGEHKQSDIQLLNVALKPGSSHAVVEIDKQVLEFEIGIPGRHIVQNALAVLGAAKFAGCDLDEAAAAFADMEPAAGRGARHQLEIEGGSFTLIDESYNANPASMRAGVALLGDAVPGQGGRRIAVLGDMLELGDFSAKLHTELDGPLLEGGVDIVLLAGPEIEVLRARLDGALHVEHFPTTDDLMPVLFRTVKAGDVVMIKSSNGIGFSRVVKALLEKHAAAGGLQQQKVGVSG